MLRGGPGQPGTAPGTRRRLAGTPDIELGRRETLIASTRSRGSPAAAPTPLGGQSAYLPGAPLGRLTLPPPRGAETRFECGVGCALVAAAWLVATVWLLAIPFSLAPDEPYHFAMVDFIRRERRLPVFGPDADMWVWTVDGGKPIESYALHPPGGYLLDALAALSRPPSWTDGMAARLPGPLLRAATVLGIWRATRASSRARPCCGSVPRRSPRSYPRRRTSAPMSTPTRSRWR